LTGATAGTRGAANFSALAVAKHGVRALSQSMAREMGPKGIHVAYIVSNFVMISYAIIICSLILKLTSDNILLKFSELHEIQYRTMLSWYFLGSN